MAGLERRTVPALGLVQTFLQDIGKDLESTLYVVQCVEIDGYLSADVASYKLAVRGLEASSLEVSAASPV